MSAFVCSPEHIKELAAYAASPGRVQGCTNVPNHYLQYHSGKNMTGAYGSQLATYYANVLWEENIRSVRYRYPDSGDDLPGPIDRPETLEVSTAEWLNRKVRNSVWILKMCDCLEYQSCETDDYRQTAGFALLQAIRRAAIGNLPGYDDAPWEYTIPKPEPDLCPVCEGRAKENPKDYRCSFCGEGG